MLPNLYDRPGHTVREIRRRKTVEYSLDNKMFTPETARWLIDALSNDAMLGGWDGWGDVTLPGLTAYCSDDSGLDDPCDPDWCDGHEVSVFDALNRATYILEKLPPDRNRGPQEGAKSWV